jgi:hypothetical protein
MIDDELMDETIAKVDAEFRRELGDAEWERFKGQ